MVAAAGRGFRRQGFGGIGVDGLAKEAEVASGAFYGHFSSKGEAFKAALVAGLTSCARASKACGPSTAPNGSRRSSISISDKSGSASSDRAAPCRA